MRGIVFVLVILILAPNPCNVLSSLQSHPAQGTDSSVMDENISTNLGPIENSSLLIVMVCPGKPVEFFALRNVGTSVICLDGHWVSDGEGILTFRSGHELFPGEELFVTANPELLNQTLPGVVSVSYASLLKKGSFVLANDGDSLQLFGPDRGLRDTFAYNDAIGTVGWEGPSFGPLPNGHMAIRKGTQSSMDTDRALDWSSSVVGRSELEQMRFQAQVQPFLYPEEALSVILDRISRSERSIDVAIYDLDEKAIVEALVQAERKGVVVRILMEGQPVAGLSSGTKRALNDLWSGGCEIKLLRSNDSYKRYDYLHCKYAIIDLQFVIVGSENWVYNAFRENRGWGAVLWSYELAQYFSDLFNNDSSPNFPDVTRMIDRFDLSPGSETPSNCSHNVTRGWFRADLTVIVSPDNSLELIRNVIGNATDRLYMEEMQFDLVWAQSSGIWAALGRASSGGCQVRLLLDSVLDDDPEGNRATMVRFREMGEMGLDMEARLASQYHEFKVIHNKGMVVDDTVLISSLNMVQGAFQENREVGVLIHCPEMADWFTSTFWEDWCIDPFPPVIILPWLEWNTTTGEQIFLDASGCWDNSHISTYSWDIGDDGSVERTSPRCLIVLPPGQHKVRLTIVDDHNNSVSKVVLINVTGPVGTPIKETLLYGPVLVASSILSLWYIRKRIKSH